MAFLFLFCFVVFHVNHGAAGKSRVEQYQGPVGVNRKSLGVFLEVLACASFPRMRTPTCTNTL